MGRRKRKQQEFNFPSAEQSPSISDAELDAEIDGASTVTEMADSVEKQRKDNEAKKNAADVIKEIPQVFTPEQVKWLFDAYIVALSFVFSVVLKTPFGPIHEELKLDDDIKDSLAKPLSRICSKYCPVEWAAMTDEIQVIATLGMISVASFRRAQAIAKQEREKAKNPQQRNANMSREGTGRVSVAGD